MDRHNIITLPDPLLRQKSQPIKKVDPETKQLITDMQTATLDWEAHRKSEVGVALAAVQVAELKQLVIVRCNFEDRGDERFDIYINPKIVKHEEPLAYEPEGCLSVPDLYGIVPRYKRITVKALNEDGKPITLQAEGFLARIFQHEIDHNHGSLFIDKVENDRFFELDSKGDLKPLSDEEIKEHHILRQRQL